SCHTFSSKRWPIGESTHLLLPLLGCFFYRTWVSESAFNAISFGLRSPSGSPPLGTAALHSCSSLLLRCYRSSRFIPPRPTGCSAERSALREAIADEPARAHATPGWNCSPAALVRGIMGRRSGCGHRGGLCDSMGNHALVTTARRATCVSTQRPRSP